MRKYSKEVSVLVLCGTWHHENGNKAQYSFMRQYENHHKFFIHFSLKKIIFQGICMLWQHKKYTYISLKHNWVHINRFAWKANDSRGIHVYLKVWQYKHIHEVKIHKTNSKMEYKFEMYESSKLDYTSTSNGFK